MQPYLDLLSNVIKNGVEKEDRTGTGTRSIFGWQMRYDLSKGFPLLTTKKIHFKSIAYELLWFIKGDTNIKFLNDNGIILLHDCLPNNFYEQATPRCQWTWNGDVWKAIVECRTDKNLDVYTCYADFGIGVIFKRPNKNLLDYQITNFSKLEFEDYHKDPYHLMNIIEYEELRKIL